MPATVRRGLTAAGKPAVSTLLGSVEAVFKGSLPLAWLVLENPIETALIAVLSTLWIARRMEPSKDEFDATATDLELLARHTKIKTFSTKRFTYPNLRVFYRRHQQADQLPTRPAPLPLLVFIHGLSGSVAQFHALLTSLTPVASCLAIDLPGCGRSEYNPHESWDAFTTDALVELLETVIEEHREKYVGHGQGMVLVGHSMGCSLAALLANPRDSRAPALSKRVVGLVAICPNAETPSEEKVRTLKRLVWVPETLFDLWRVWDRRGGEESPSVKRFVGEGARQDAKRLQNLYNHQSRTPVLRRMAAGMLPTYEGGRLKGGLPGKETWSRLNIPVLLVGGRDDKVTPPENLDKIAEFIRKGRAGQPQHVSSVEQDEDKDHGAPHEQRPVNAINEDDFTRLKPAVYPTDTLEIPTTAHEHPLPPVPPQLAHPPQVLEKHILPRPATHALFFDPATARILAGLMSDFLEHCITARLSLGWQLQYLSREGKWDVKNLEKWKGVVPVSEPVPPPPYLGQPIFRAMKTLRQVDELHCPREFCNKWSGIIKDVIDISHDNPVYDPQDLEKGGTHYHKFATVSKVPPTDAEVAGFVELVDRLRGEQDESRCIGVHCHYGFNRTGYFIVCYLVERCGFAAQEAIEAFARARPNGIKHEHFKNRLCVRYAGLEKARRED